MWVVDTCVLIDVLEDDPGFGRHSAQCLAKHLSDGLVIAPITYVELAPTFEGSPALQEEFLRGVGVGWEEPWTWTDTRAAHGAWNLQIERRRAGRVPKRPVADILIGAFACRFRGLITRNGADFRPAFPTLALTDPMDV